VSAEHPAEHTAGHTAEHTPGHTAGHTAGRLELQGVSAGYGGVDAVRDLDLVVEPGRLGVLIGPNGAGKSTTLRCVAGLMRPRTGQILYDGQRIDRMAPSAIAKLGITQVPEGRRLFGRQSIADNLLVGGWVRRRDRKGLREDQERMYERFPILGNRRDEAAASLSGGEAQMLAIAMALMARPSVLLLDEPSLGLAPLAVNKVFETVSELAKEGVTILLVEQMVHKALSVADHVHVLSRGSIVLHGPADEVAGHPAVRDVYLGAAATAPRPS
jgi:branched-chain amino acid transport system ATP-binding protein